LSKSEFSSSDICSILKYSSGRSKTIIGMSVFVTPKKCRFRIINTRKLFWLTFSYFKTGSVLFRLTVPSKLFSFLLSFITISSTVSWFDAIIPHVRCNSSFVREIWSRKLIILSTCAFANSFSSWLIFFSWSLNFFSWFSNRSSNPSIFFFMLRQNRQVPALVFWPSLPGLSVRAPALHVYIFKCCKTFNY